jgi:hypothetical protein
MDFSALTTGGPIPTVNPGDLRGVWELMRETSAEFLRNREPELGGQQPAIGICTSLLARVCSPEGNVLAVWARSALLWTLVHQGLLTAWQRGTQLDDAVFDVAAAFPIPGLDRFDQDAFLQQLSSRRGPPDDGKS